MNRQLNFQSESIRSPWDFESIVEAFDTELADVELEGETSGNSAERTRWVQQSLNKILGLRLAVDGIMGPQTRSAIRSFQKQRGLVADGVVSPKTEAGLLAALKGTAPAPASFSSMPGSTRRPLGNVAAPGGASIRGSSDRTKLPPGVNYPPPPGYRVLRGSVPREVVAKANEILRRPDPIGTQIPLLIGGKDYLFAVEWHKHAPTDRVPKALKRWHRGVTVYGRANGSLQQPPAPSAPPGYTPSLTRQRFAEAVARNDWREAFLNLNGLNMYEMLRALDALSPERRNGLAAKRQTYRGLVNMPRIDYAMTVVETGRLPPVAPGDLATTGQIPTAAEFLRERQSRQPGLAWGARVSPEFRRRIREISASLGCDPNHLMAVIAFESGETFSPSIRNRLSGATGLIQFMPLTARRLGTTTDTLAAMTAEQQLEYVARYFAPYKGRLQTLEDVYMTVLWPRAVGAPNETVLFAAPSKAYEQNKGLDRNRDGAVTKFEAAAFVRDKLSKGLKSGIVG